MCVAMALVKVGVGHFYAARALCAPPLREIQCVAVELVAWLSVCFLELVSRLTVSPESWTRAGHLFREKYYENTRELLLWFS